MTERIRRKINQNFNHIQNPGCLYVIKCARKASSCGHAFLMRVDGKGHVYAGQTTPVNDVWEITDAEFMHMANGHPEWFELVDRMNNKDGEASDLVIKDSGVDYLKKAIDKIDTILGETKVANKDIDYLEFRVQFK